MDEQIEATMESKKDYFDKKAVLQILEARKWTMFLSVAGFILMGLFLIIMLMVSAGFGQSNSPYPALAIIPALVIMVIYFFPIYFLFKFSVISKQALTENSIYSLGDAFEYLKKHYQFMSVLMIILIGLYAIFFSIALILGDLIK